MQHIIRPKYIKQITQFVDKPVIKVLTGMRRVGKSTLLTMIKDEILKNIPDNNKIYLNFESAELFDITTAKALHTYLQPLIKRTKGKIYFFFDEIQMVSGWERVVNGLSVDKDCDIYITGSNSTLISGDLATLLSGRYTAFEIYPFTFGEFMQIFKNKKRAVSIDTVLNYLEYCKNAFIIKKVSRYDIAGKKLLKVDEKYYVTDHGLRQAQGFSNTKDIERTLENIVFIELASRGYEVKIGKLKDREIDFIAQKNDRIFYYQVAYMLTDEKTREREFGVYKSIEDNFPKYVLSMDHFDFGRDGVIHKNIIDFLLETVS